MRMSFALRSFGMGFVAGLRSMTAPAVARPRRAVPSRCRPGYWRRRAVCRQAADHAFPTRSRGWRRACQYDTATGAEDALLGAVQPVRGDIACFQGLSTGVAEDDLHVVGDLPAVLPVVNPTRGDRGFRRGAENGVGEIDLVRSQLSQQSSRPLAVEPPIQQPL